MSAYHFPLLFIAPDAEWEPIEAPPYRLTRRHWQTTSFDFATLGAHHKLHLPYQLMEVLLAHCNLEVSVEAPDQAHAVDSLHALLLSLYIEGLSPTLSPVVATHSINEYSGINSRDSDALREKLPEGIRTGFTTRAGKVEAWPVHLSLSCQVVNERLTLDEATFQRAAAHTHTWMELENRYPALRVVRDAASQLRCCHLGINRCCTFGAR